MDLKLLPLSAIVSSIVAIICVIIAAIFKGLGDTNNGPAQGSADYIPILYVAIGAIFLLYTFFWNQSYTAFKEHQLLKQRFEEGGYENVDNNPPNNKSPTLAQVKYGGNNKSMQNANRFVGNLQEQMIPFLFSMYAYATYVNAVGAAQIGWAWLFFRSYYPFVFTKRFPWLFASTLPAYGCIWFMLLRAAYVATMMNQ